jgi:hypothetical protein
MARRKIRFLSILPFIKGITKRMIEEFQSVYEGVRRNRGIAQTPAVVFYPPNKSDIVIVRVTAPLAEQLGWDAGQKVDLLISRSTHKARLHVGHVKGWSPRKGKPSKDGQQELHIQIRTVTKGVFVPTQKETITDFREIGPGVIEFDLPEGEIKE